MGHNSRLTLGLDLFETTDVDKMAIRQLKRLETKATLTSGLLLNCWFVQANYNRRYSDLLIQTPRTVEG
jgi:hypothetical protein